MDNITSTNTRMITLAQLLFGGAHRTDINKQQDSEKQQHTVG